MLLDTKYFGQVDVDQEQFIQFPQGIPGFIEEKEFVLLNLEEGGIFQVLQSTKQVNPAFIVVNPFLFAKDYQFKLDDPTIKQLEIESENDVNVLAVVTLKDPIHTTTANLQGPIVINQRKQIAKQYITNNNTYSTKEIIFNNTSMVEEG